MNHQAEERALLNEVQLQAVAVLAVANFFAGQLPNELQTSLDALGRRVKTVTDFRERLIREYAETQHRNLRPLVNTHPQDCGCDYCLNLLACEVVLARPQNNFAPQTTEITR